MTEKSHRDRALSLARKRGVERSRDFDAAGVPRVYLKRLEEEGALLRIGRGLYQDPHAKLSAHHSLAEAALAAPRGVIGLLSALQFHQLTTQTPHEVWMLMPSKAWTPTAPPVRLRILRASSASLAAGVERHLIDGVKVAITSPAKTVADCFKYRSKVGLDVALEALREALRTRRASADDIWRFAKIDRVATVMRPYMEAIT
jgi:predicted transcriptional regulator of viral defense system